MLTDVILSEVRVGSGPAEGGMGVIHPCTVLGLERTEWLSNISSIPNQLGERGTISVGQWFSKKKSEYPMQYSKVPLRVCVPPFENHWCMGQ